MLSPPPQQEALRAGLEREKKLEAEEWRRVSCSKTGTTPRWRIEDERERAEMEREKEEAEKVKGSERREKSERESERAKSETLLFFLH